MPKLTTAMAKKVYATETGQRQGLLPEGMYRAKLTGVVVSAKKDRNNNEYWVWSYEVTQETGKGAKFRNNTGFGDDQLWTVKGSFEAFDAKPNVDTDTLVGKECVLVIDQHEGSGRGGTTRTYNGVVEVLPLSALDTSGGEDDPWADEPGEGGGDDPDF